MTQQSVLAFKIERLQMLSDQQRQQFALEVVALLPVFNTIDHLRNGVRWIREHPALIASAIITIAVARPRRVIRWTRRGWLTWLAWCKLTTSDADERPSQNRLIERFSSLFSAGK